MVLLCYSCLLFLLSIGLVFRLSIPVAFPGVFPVGFGPAVTLAAVARVPLVAARGGIRAVHAPEVLLPGARGESLPAA